MNLIRHTDARFEAKLAKLAAASTLFDPVIEQRTLDIVRGVERNGDKALLQYTQKFDGAKLRAADLAVPTKRLAEAWKIPPENQARHTPGQGERRLVRQAVSA